MFSQNLCRFIPTDRITADKLQGTDRFTDAFARLGIFLNQFPSRSRSDAPGLQMVNRDHYDSFLLALKEEPVLNPWFTPDYLDKALQGISRMLVKDVLEKWLSSYDHLSDRDPLSTGEGSERTAGPGGKGPGRTVGLVMAGNIPLVGFHDLLCILAAGHNVLAKTSSRDDRLIRLVAGVLSAVDPELGGRITFTEGYLRGMDAVIATGSNNSARYFEYYFREIPHIIRKNRNGVAVLTGGESEEELVALGEDIFTYFGMGCRNVTKLYVPAGYDLTRLMQVLDRYGDLYQHHRYGNNVDYYRTIYLMNRVSILDNGVIILKEDPEIASPVGVVFYERYPDIETVSQELATRQDQVQCVVSTSPDIPGTIPPGSTQLPMPWDYADGIDTLEFLKVLN